MALILFDFDGVLADTQADLLRFAQEACDELGVTHRVVEADLSDLEVMSFATLGQACGASGDLVDEFVRKCTGKFAARTQPPPIFDGLAVVVRDLARNHVLAVVTGNTGKNVLAFLAAHGLTDCFRAVYGLDNPGSKVLKIGMARDDLAPHDEAVFMVGDSVSDVRAANQAGVKSVAVSWGHQSLARLLDALPDHVAHTPRDLIDIAKDA